MSAAEALKAARAAGIQLGIDGDALVLEADSAPPAAVLDALSRHKAELWHCFDPTVTAGQPRTGSPASTSVPALLSSMAGCRVRRPRSRLLPAALLNGLTATLCVRRRDVALACGDRNHPHDPLLPYGIEPTGHAWLHGRCWPAWYAGRKAEAEAALAAMGIATLADGDAKHRLQLGQSAAPRRFVAQRQINGD